LRLSGGCRCRARHLRFGVDDQRGGSNRKTGACLRSRPEPQRRPKIRPLSCTDGGSRDHPPVFRSYRNLVLRAARRPCPRRRSIARICPRPVWRQSGGRMKAPLLYLGLIVCAVALFLLVPNVDLAVAGLFYRPDAGFPLSEWWLVRFVEQAIPW